MGADPAKEEIFQDAVFEPYALAIGQAVLAWNDLHKWLGLLLESILFPRGSNASGARPLYGFWEAMTQDRAARNMIRAAAEYKYGYGLHGDDAKDNFDKIMWLLGQINRLEDARNDIIHTALMRDATSKVGVSCEGGSARARNLRAKPDLLAEIHWCRDTAIALRNYVLDVDRGLEYPSGTLPKTPSLPNRGQKRTPPSQPPQPQSE